MGDDMAIRSGGMYGNPESAYTLAKPVSGGFRSGAGAGFGFFGRSLKAITGIAAANDKYEAEKDQIEADLYSLRKEKEYNLKNFQQTIADRFAQNKMSFYSSGLDLSSGSAQDVIENNRLALQEDMQQMAFNYNMQEWSLKEKQKALRGNLIGDIASSVLSIF